MSSGYRVEYSEDLNEVCIIPRPGIPIKHMSLLAKAYKKLGYCYWLPADERRGLIFAKKIEEVKDED